MRQSCTPKQVGFGSTEDEPMTVSMQRMMVKLERPTMVAAFLIQAQHVVDRMTGNPWFPNPVPALTEVQARIDALDSSETEALSLARGLKQARNADSRRLVSAMDLLRAFVQFTADENFDHAADIIESAGMSVKGRSYPVKEAFSARPGRVSGAVKLMVLAAGKVVAYHWQTSADGGQTWQELPSTLQAQTVVTGLVPQKSYLFRYHVVVRSGPLDWSEPVSIVVR
jgi:hypothetical protein